MVLKILGSSSSGNCYVLDNGKEALVVECGLPLAEVKKAVGFDVSRIAGCLVSHEHGDHAGHVKSFIRARVPVWGSIGTIVAVEGCVTRPKMGILDPCRRRKVGNFTVLPFDVQHDAAEPLGFIIYHPEMGTTLFATDTYYLRYRFAGLNNIMIECNYRTDILEANVASGKVPEAQRRRTVKSHMEYATCREALLANDLTAVSSIVLIHLSDGNSNAAEFRQGIREATGKTVHVAERGMIINFNKTPF
jgi:phosphoribosyl 1,2-cyclic phosphodiesterase